MTCFRVKSFLGRLSHLPSSQTAITRVFNKCYEITVNKIISVNAAKFQNIKVNNRKQYGVVKRIKNLVGWIINLLHLFCFCRFLCLKSVVSNPFSVPFTVAKLVPLSAVHTPDKHMFCLLYRFKGK